MVELCEPNDGLAQLVRSVVARLRVELLDVERMAFQPRRGLARGESLLRKGLAVADATDVRDEHPDQHRDGARHWVAGAFEQRLARGEDRGQISSPPGVGELVTGNFRTADGEELDLLRA